MNYIIWIVYKVFQARKTDLIQLILKCQIVPAKIFSLNWAKPTFKIYTGKNRKYAGSDPEVWQNI